MTHPVATTCESCSAPLPPATEHTECDVCRGEVEVAANPLEARDVALRSLMVLSVNGSENARLRAAELILETTLPMPDEW